MKNIFYYSIAFLVSIFGYTSDANFDRTVEVISVPWTITANFETGTLGEKANGSDGFSGAFGNTIYSNTQANSGSQSAEVGIKAGETGFGQWGGSFNFPSVLGEGDEVWFRTYLYFPDGFPFITDSGFLKTMRIHTRTAAGGSGSNEGYHDILIRNNGTHIVVGSEITSDWYRNNPNWKKNGEPTTTGKWHALEHYIKFSSVPGQGITRVWQNGVLIKEDIVTKTLRSSTSVSDFTYLFTYWNGGAPSNVKAYVDDVIITSQTPANRDAAGNPFIGLSTTLSTENPTNEFENSTLVYPNPFSNDVSIDLGKTFTEISAKIHNVDGKLIQENIFKNTNTISLKLNADAGIYFITVNSHDKKAVFKVVKE